MMNHCALFLLALLCVPLPLCATTYYVGPSGNDRTACAEAQHPATPRRTLNQGLACLRGGDTLIAQPGQYDEIVTDFAGIGGYTVPIPSGSSWSSLTTIKAETPGTVILTVSSPPSGWASVVELSQPRYVSVEGLVIDAGFRLENGIGLGGQFLRFKDLEIRYGKGQGIQGACTGCEFLTLHVHDIGRRQGQTTCSNNVCGNPNGIFCPGYCHGIYLTGTQNLIDGGSYHDNDGHAIHLYPGPRNNIVRNLTVARSLVGIGIYGPDHQVYNNVLIDNQIHIHTSNNNVIAHNTLYGTINRDGSGNVYGIYSRAGGDILKNNLVLRQLQDKDQRSVFVQADSPPYNQLARGVNPAMVGGNVCDNPGMVGCTVVAAPCLVQNGPGEDVHLCADSPARAAGVPVPLATMATDKDGMPRPLTGPDVGAYQGGGVPLGTVPLSPQHLRVVATP